MKLVNDGIPDAIYRALCNDRYDPGDSDYTPSSLIAPAYQRRLIHEYRDEIEENASDRIWALLGSAVHYMIELGGEDSSTLECERRFYGMSRTTLGQFRIGAQVDILDHSDNSMYDMKVTSAWAYGKGVKPEWEAQLNVCRWCIFRETGNVVDSLNIVAIFRDWSKRDASKPNYPPKQSCTIQVPVWGMSETTTWIAQKVVERELAMRAEQIADITPCTSEETWAKPDKYAVQREGANRATKIFDLEEHAREYAQDKEGYIVVKRHGERTRCESYCAVSSHCPNYQQHLKEVGK